MAAANGTENSQRKYEYDVFLNFRGTENIRKGFVDHLYAALDENGIRIFRDDEGITYGREIGSECLKAIEDSQSSIVVLSKDYASSSWCLDELVHILKCKKEFGHHVLVVFYDVSHSDVKQQTGCFLKAFENHQMKEEMERVEKWRAALKEVAAFERHDIQNHQNGHEAKNIEKIRKEILDHLLDAPVIPIPSHPSNWSTGHLRVNSFFFFCCLFRIALIENVASKCLSFNVCLSQMSLSTRMDWPSGGLRVEVWNQTDARSSRIYCI